MSAELEPSPAELGFFPIAEWGKDKALQSWRVAAPSIVSRPDGNQDWIDPETFRSYLDQERARPGSPCPTLVSYERDADGAGLKLGVAQSSYFEHVAASRYLRDHPSEYEAVVARFRGTAGQDGLASAIASAPASNIVINVTVQSRDGKVMMFRRPSGARVWPGFHQFGAHETMNWKTPGQELENCFELARRALIEEVGLRDPEDYGDNIVFSWFGLYAPDVSAYFFAHVRTRLETFELAERVLRAESSYEVADLDFVELDRTTIARVAATWADGPWTPGVDVEGRQYLPHAAVALAQLWRVTNDALL